MCRVPLTSILKFLDFYDDVLIVAAERCFDHLKRSLLQYPEQAVAGLSLTQCHLGRDLARPVEKILAATIIFIMCPTGPETVSHTGMAAPNVIQATEMFIFVTEPTADGSSRKDMAAGLNETDAVVLNMQVHCVTQQQQECEIDIYRVYNVKAELKMYQIRDRNEPMGENLLSNHDGATLNVVTVKYSRKFPPGQKYNRTTDLKVYIDAGFEFLMLDALLFSMNFTLSTFMVKHHTNFSHETQSYGEGQVLSLLNGEADFALAATTEPTVNDSRIQFNLPIDSLKLVAVFRKPEMSRDPFAQARPLSAPLWVAIISWLVVNMAVLAVCKIITVCYTVRMTRAASGSGAAKRRAGGASVLSRVDRWRFRLTLADMSIVLGPICLLCSVGIEELPEENSLRAIVTTLSATALVFNMVYGAKLLSFLTVDVQPYGTIDALLGTSYKFGAYSFDIAETMFKQSGYTSMRKAYGRIESFRGLLVSAAKDDLMRGSYAFLTTDLYVENFLHEDETTKAEICSLTEVYLPGHRIMLSQYVLKGSPYKRIMDYQIIRTRQFGLNDVWNRRDRYGRPPCPQTVFFDAIPVQSVALCFILFVSGFPMSLLAFLLELFREYSRHDSVGTKSTNGSV